MGDASPRSPSCPAWVRPGPSLLKLPPPLGSPHPRLRVTTPGGGQCRQMPGRVCGAGGHYHFVGGPGGVVGGGAGWELQAPPLVPCRAALAPPHAVHLLLHTHFGLAFAREHSTLGALLLLGEDRARTGALPCPWNFYLPKSLKISLLWEACL